MLRKWRMGREARERELAEAVSAREEAERKLQEAQHVRRGLRELREANHVSEKLDWLISQRVQQERKRGQGEPGTAH
jgi:hypothetical protein